MQIYQGPYNINTLPAIEELCRLLINFANSLVPDQARQNVGPDLDPNCLTRHWSRANGIPEIAF